MSSFESAVADATSTLSRLTDTTLRNRLVRVEQTPGDETTSDRYITVNGRRWRATDPTIPEKLKTELVAELMAARRAVRAARGDEAAVASARARVHDAKVALGERGEPWWDAPTDDGRADRLAAAMRTLLRHRDPDKTICPSDAARVVGGSAWRQVMEPARAVARMLADAGVVEVRQHGRPVAIEGARGPVRLARGPAWG